jgi:preprotein translocase subunit SecF
MYIFQNSNFDFLRWRWHAFALSLVVIAAGIVMLASGRLPMGVEFEGGTVVIAQFERDTSIGTLSSR